VLGEHRKMGLPFLSFSLRAGYPPVRETSLFVPVLNSVYSWKQHRKIKENKRRRAQGEVAAKTGPLQGCKLHPVVSLVQVLRARTWIHILLVVQPVVVEASLVPDSRKGEKVPP